MKRLVILRHAKAEAHDPSRDHQRVLTARGHSDAEKVGKFLFKCGHAPELVLCSDSTRTTETWNDIAPLMAGNIKLERSRKLYLAEAQDLLSAIARVNDRYSRVMLVGHNPGCAELALALLRDRHSKVARRAGSKFPTAALAIIDLPIDAWQDVAPEIGEFEDFVVPADL